MTDNRVNDKIDKIVNDVNEIKVQLSINNAHLAEHMKRSDMLEKKLAPVEAHVERVNGVLKLIGVMAMIAAIIEASFKLLGK